MLPISRKLRRVNWRFRLWVDPARGGIIEWSIFAVVIGALIAAGFDLIR